MQQLKFLTVLSLVLLIGLVQAEVINVPDDFETIQGAIDECMNKGYSNRCSGSVHRESKHPSQTNNYFESFHI